MIVYAVGESIDTTSKRYLCHLGSRHKIYDGPGAPRVAISKRELLYSFKKSQLYFATEQEANAFAQEKAVYEMQKYDLPAESVFQPVVMSSAPAVFTVEICDQGKEKRVIQIISAKLSGYDLVTLNMNAEALADVMRKIDSYQYQQQHVVIAFFKQRFKKKYEFFCHSGNFSGDIALLKEDNVDFDHATETSSLLI